MPELTWALLVSLGVILIVLWIIMRCWRGADGQRVGAASAALDPTGPVTRSPAATPLAHIGN